VFIKKKIAGFYDFIGFACKCRERLLHNCTKHCLDFFLCIVSSSTCLKEPVFSKLDLLPVEEGTSQTVPGLFDEMKVPTSLSLFLKNEKIPAFTLGK